MFKSRRRQPNVSLRRRSGHAPRLRRLLSKYGVVAALAGGVSLAASAAFACEDHKIDLGGGKFVKGGCEPLKIAFLSLGTNNVYLQAGIKGAKDAAAKAGASIDVFDAGWSATTQYNQAQNIISGGKYNAVVAEMANGVQVCKMLTEDAPAKGLIVSAANQPLCDRATKEAEEYWSPGTLNYVGGTQGLQAWREALAYILKQAPGPQKVAVITGPDLIVQTITIDQALKELHAAHPEFQVVAEVRTDYSLPQAYQKSLPLLAAHPDITMVIGNYSDLTRGAVQAIKQAGLEGKIKVFDNGGSSWAFDAVKSGEVFSTRTYTPYTEMYKSVESLAAAWKGGETPRYVPLQSDYVTKANVNDVKPEY
jgi:ribose transport system substrate-binding protein